jgi:hypothetical protein
MSKSQGTARAARPPRTTSTTAHRPSPPPATAPWRRRHPMLFALIPVALVVLAIVTMVVVKTTGGSATPSTATASGSSSRLVSGGTPATGANGTSTLPAGVLTAVTSVTPATLAAVGIPASLALPSRVTGNGAIARSADGQALITYIGAEYCPFCAAERWAVVQALSRFGTFSNLSATHSSTTDIYPDTKTFSFYGSSYTSAYVDFAPVEESTNQPAGDGYATLQTPTAAQSALLSTYDVAPYTSEPGSIPFLDIANKYVVVGASYNPQILAGLSMTAIARDLSSPNSLVATAIDGTANAITAAICSVTGDQPAVVCATATTSAAGKKLAG